MSASMDFSEFDFSGAMRDISQGMLVKPVLHNYLFDARFPAFDLHFEEQEMERKPDGWFHPSTHPLWPARNLYNYLATPDIFPVEKKQYMGTLAVTIGKVMHEFVQMCLTDAGIRPAALQVCQVCPPKYQCKEAGVRDDDLGERGHLDGVLSFDGFPNVPEAKMEPVFEFKTSHDNFGKLTKMEDLDAEAFKKKWPIYWGQQQRYLRLSGRPYSIVLMMETMYPFTMREFHIAYDPGWNAQIDAKYHQVRQAVADQRPPICCGQRGCESAILCGIVR
jgi:hypothetical protein